MSNNLEALVANGKKEAWLVACFKAGGRRIVV
jgi:hypothetical protein